MDEILKMIKKIIAIAGLIAFSYSCIGYYPKEVFTPLQDEPITCNKKDSIVALYFEGEPINFEYEKVGLIEIQGANYDNDSQVIRDLKKLAIAKCCDAVIGIRKGSVEREEGLAFVGDGDFTYKSITYYGIGIRRN